MSTITKEEYEARVARFERAIEQWNSNPGRGNFNLAKLTMNVDGREHIMYSDPDTDNAWLGFQWAESMANAKVKP